MVESKRAVSCVERLREDHETEGILLRSVLNWDPATAELVRQWRNDERVRRWMYAGHIITPKEHAEFLERLRNDNRHFRWLVSVAGKPVAVLGLIKCDFRNGTAYWDFFMNPDLIGKGLGWITDYIGPHVAFEIAKLRTLKLEILAENEHLIGMHKKAGFQVEGRLRAFVEREEGVDDVLVMGMMAEEWNANRQFITEKVRQAVARAAAVKHSV